MQPVEVRRIDVMLAKLRSKWTRAGGQRRIMLGVVIDFYLDRRNAKR